MTTKPKSSRKPEGKLPTSLVKAAARIRSHSFGRILRIDQLKEIVTAEPRAKWDDYAEFHLFETTHWGEPGEKPSVRTAMSCSGSELALENAATMLWMLRAQEAGYGPRKITNTYQLVYEVHHSVNRAVAWLDCETGVISKGRCWQEAEALAAREKAMPEIREIKSDAEQPSGPSDFVTHGSREDVVMDCTRDFRCLPEWRYVIRELRPNEWHVWQVKAGEETPAKPVRPLAVGDVVRCYEDPATEKEVEGDCILMSKVRDGDDGREMWSVRFASDGIGGPLCTRSVHVRNRYNNAESSEEGVGS